MNMYVNLCSKTYAEKTETLTLDVPPDMMDPFMQYVHVLLMRKTSQHAVPFKTWCKALTNN